MANEEKELLKFVQDPNYREKIINRIHKDSDAQYNKRIKIIESDRNRLSQNKLNEIKRIANARWEKFGGALDVNRVEGKIRINNTESYFSSIKGADLNIQYGYRTVTNEVSHSKKHASVGGAIGGGLLFGPVGAMVGGVGLGKTKTTGHSSSNQIPTCLHLGVMVNIDGFVSEITLLSRQVDQSSITFARAQGAAQSIVAQLGALSHTPVPSTFLKPEEELSVTQIEQQIQNKQKELENAINDRPTYALPAMYRTQEQRDLSDADYLTYLEKQDEERQMQEEAEKNRAKAEKDSAREASKAERREKLANFDYGGTAKKTFVIIGIILFWALSVIYMMLALGVALSGGIISCLIFVISGLFINPLIFKLINNKITRIPVWVCIIVLIVGFFAGILTSPQSNKNSYVPSDNIIFVASNIKL